MGYSLKDLSGGCWSVSDQWDLAGKEGLGDRLTWPRLVEVLVGAEGLDPGIIPALVMLRLELPGAMDPSTTQLEQAAANDELARWLLHQIALQQSSRELFEAWYAREEEAHDGVLPAIIQAKAALSRGILFEDVTQALYLSAGWDRTGSGKGFAWPLLHLIQGGIAQAAAALDGENPSSLLMAAHLEGDILDRPARQEELLFRVIDASSTLMYEALIELSLRSENIDMLVKVLQARFAALQSKSGYYAEACATTLLLMEHQAGAENTEDLELLGDAHAAEAWRHLVSMVRRLTVVANTPQALPGVYLKEAEAQPKQALAEALRLRAAELLMAGGDWAAALAALPEGGVDPTLTDLNSRYSAICHCQLQAWAKLSDHLVNLTPCEAEPADRIQLLSLASIFALKEPNTARQRLLNIGRIAEQQQDPSLPPLLGALLATHHCLGDDLMVARLWMALQQRTRDPREQALFAFAAGLTQHRGGNLEGALKNFSVARDADPANPVLIAAATSTLAALGRWAEVADGIGELIDRVGSADVTELHRALSYICAQQLEQPERALEQIQRVLARRPGEQRAMLEEAALHLRLGHFSAACSVLEQAVEATEGVAAGADLLCQVGEIQRGQLSDNSAAEEAYRRALELNSRHEGALRGLRQVLTTMKRLTDMPQVLTRLLELAEQETERLNLLVEVARIHYQLWEDDQTSEHAAACIDFARQALVIAPTNEKALSALVQACTDLHGWDELIRHLSPLAPTPTALRGLCRAYMEISSWEELAKVQEQLARCSPDEEGKVAARSAAELRLQRLDDPEQAEVLLRWGFDQFQDVEALLQLANLLRGQSRVEDLAALIEGSIASLDAEEHLTALFSLAELMLTMGSIQQALQCYEAALRIDAFNEIALSAMEPLLEGERRFTELAHLLESRLISVDDGEEELRILLRLGQIYALLDDPGSELRIAKRLHNHSPDKDPVAHYVEEVYRKGRLHQDLIRLFNQRIKFMEQSTGDPQVMSALLVQKGDIELHELGSPEDAVKSYAAAVICYHEDLAPLKVIEGLLVDPGQRQALIDVYQEIADGISVRGDQVALLEQAIKITREELREEEGAIGLFEQIHELDPDHSAAYSFLEQQYRFTKDYKKLVKLLVERAGRVPSQSEELRCLLRAADLCEKTQNVERAIKLYQRVLAIDPSRVPALKALARIFESLERWEEFLKITQRQIETEEIPAKSAILHFKCGSVMETQYHADNKAMRHYKQAILTNPSCLPALHSLREIHSRRENWSEVVATLKLEAPAWKDEKARASVLAQIAEICASKLNDWERSHAYCLRALDADPENLVAALALFRFSIDQQNLPEAERWGEICQLRIEEFGNQGQGAEFLEQWADVLLRRDRAAEAAETLLQVYDSNPGRLDLLARLVELCQQAPGSFDFTGVFTAMLREAGKDNNTHAEAILSVGCGLLREQQADMSGALALYERGVSAAPERFELARYMAEAMLHLGSEEEAEALMQRCRLAADGVSEPDWIEASLWIVQLQLTRFGAYDAAAELCQEVLAQLPGQVQALIALGQVEAARKHLTVAAEVYQHACDRLRERGADTSMLAQCLHARGQLIYQLGDHGVAGELWKEAQQVDPERSYSFISAARALAESGDTKGVLQQLELATESCTEGLPELLAAVEVLAGRDGKRRSLCAKLEARIQQRMDLEELVLLARFLAREERAPQAIALLQQLLLINGRYLPAIDDLRQLWMAQHEKALTRRAGVVMRLALSEAEEDPEADAGDLLTRPLGSAGWTAITADLEQHPLTMIWKFFERNARDWLPQRPSSRITTKNQLKAISEQVMEVFGVQLKLAVTKEEAPLFQIFNKIIILPSSVTERPDVEILAALAMGACALKAGHGPLFSAAPLLRLEIASIMASMLRPEESWPEQARELVANLPTRVQRQLRRGLGRLSLGSDQADIAAGTWLAAVEGLCIKLALMVTDDLIAVTSVLGLNQHGPGTWASVGGIFSNDPGVEHFSHIYLSEYFHQVWRAIKG